MIQFDWQTKREWRVGESSYKTLTYSYSSFKVRILLFIYLHGQGKGERIPGIFSLTIRSHLNAFAGERSYRGTNSFFFFNFKRSNSSSAYHIGNMWAHKNKEEVLWMWEKNNKKGKLVMSISRTLKYFDAVCSGFNKKELSVCAFSHLKNKRNSLKLKIKHSVAQGKLDTQCQK